MDHTNGKHTHDSKNPRIMPRHYSSMYCEYCSLPSTKCKHCPLDAPPCRPFGTHQCPYCDEEEGELCHPELNMLAPHFMRIVEQLPETEEETPESFHETSAWFEKELLEGYFLIRDDVISVLACLNTLDGEQRTPKVCLALRILENRWNLLSSQE
jgi:hypothetical protein